MRQFYWALCYVFLVKTVFVFGQTYRVAGIVTDANEQPISGAHIHLEQLTTYTDSLGNFNFARIKPQSYRMKISHIAFESFDSLLVVQSDVDLKIKLIPKSISFGNVNVMAKKRADFLVENTLQSVEVQEFKHANFGELLQEISGVSALKTGNNLVKPIINGLHSSRVVIVQNGIRQEDQQWGNDHAPNISVHALNEVSVVQGVKTLHYAGDALGGLIMTKPLQIPKIDTLFGSQSTTLMSNGRGGVLNASLFKGYRSGWYASFQTTFKKTGDLEAPSYVLSNTGTKELHFSTNFGFRNSTSGFDVQYSFFDANIGILRASHIGNVTDLVRAINSGQPQFMADFTYEIGSPRQESTHHFLKANYYHRFENQSKINIDYGLQYNNRKEFDVRRGDNNRPAVNLKLATHSIQTIFENPNYKKVRFFTGFSGTYQNNFSDTESTGIRALIPNYNKFDAGFFATTNFDLADNLVFESGIRYDFSKLLATKFYTKERWEEMGYDSDFSSIIVGDFNTQWKTKPEFTFHNLAFSSDILWKINDNNNVMFVVNIYNRNPNPAELFSDGLHHATGQIELGDLRLKQEQGVKFSARFKQNFNKGFWQLSPYIQRVNNFMLLEPIGVETNIRGAFPVWQYKATEALLKGFDAEFQYDLMRNLAFSTQLAVVYGDDLTQNRPLQNMPPIRWKQNLRWTSNQPKPWEIAFRHEIVFTQKRFPDNDFETLVPQDGDLVPVLVSISRPPSGYQWSQLAVNKQWNAHFLNAKYGTIETGIVMQNLFNAQYRDYLNSMRFYADEMGRNILIQVQFNF
uniref:TonB-dependent receptor n=1 Tax=Flavobacterium sp. TaxID=239 RepID=UPI0040491DAC